MLKQTIIIIIFCTIKFASSDCCARRPGFLWSNCWSDNEESCGLFCCGCETNSCYTEEKIKLIQDFMENPKFRKFYFS